MAFGSLDVARRQVNLGLLFAWRFSNLLTSGGLSPALSDLFRPGSGEHVLPHEVIAMLDLLRTNSATEFALTEEIRRSSLLTQRITEAAYPRIEVASASVLLATQNERLPDKCRTMAYNAGFVLARCG